MLSIQSSNWISSVYNCKHIDYTVTSAFTNNIEYSFIHQNNQFIFSVCKFLLHYFFLENFDSIYFCVSKFWSDSALQAVILLCIMFYWEISSFYTLQIVWCSNKITVNEFLVNLVKIIDENSSNLINQQFSKLLKMTEFWSIHDKNWSFFKLE